MARYFARASGSANPDSQSRILARAQVLLDGLKSMMAATAGTRPQPELAQRQIRVIHDDQQARERDAIKIHHGGDCFAARIHKSLRLTEQRLTFIQFSAGDSRAEFLFILPIGLPAFGQLIHNDESGVVAGFGVIPARIAQADDEK
jgi:hypothetical protein